MGLDVQEPKRLLLLLYTCQLLRRDEEGLCLGQAVTIAEALGTPRNVSHLGVVQLHLPPMKGVAPWASILLPLMQRTPAGCGL